MGKTKGKMIRDALRGFAVGVIVAPLMPFLLAWECAQEDWWVS